MKIVVTGGAGYIGSHFIEAWLQSEHAHETRLWIIDDLSSGHQQLIDVLRIQAKERGIREFHFERISVLDPARLAQKIFEINPDLVYHFAGKISVGESVEKPDLYFDYNVKGSKHLLQAMAKTQCRKLVFSSTAAVYEPSADGSPLLETSSLSPSNPYGENKLQVESMIEHAAKEWGLNSIVFRYFNAAGASLSGRMGEWHEPETHLIPLLLESAMGESTKPLKVFGDDYPTRDGTCVRDYIHVADLAQAHVLAADYLNQVSQPKVAGARAGGSFEVMNLGTEQGATVKEVVLTAMEVLQTRVAHEVVKRRPGDASSLVASSAKARQLLGWAPKHSDLKTILDTAWKWQKTLSQIKG
jgi:UDP-glucose 4-epimerase